MKALLGALLLLAASSRASETTLQKIEVRDDGIVFQTSQPVRYAKTRLTDPDRVIFELPGVRCAICPKNLSGKGKWLEGVRAGQFMENPPITRVVLDLTGAAPVADKAEGASVSVQLGDAPKAAPPVVEAPKPAPVVAAPKPHPALPRAPDFMETFQTYFVFGGMAFALLTLCVALYRIRWMRSNEAAVRAYGEQEARRVEKKLDDEIQQVRRRVSAIEAKLAQLQEDPRGGDSVSAEELKELRTVLRSLTN